MWARVPQATSSKESGYRPPAGVDCRAETPTVMESPKLYGSLSVDLLSEAGGRLPATVSTQPTVGSSLGWAQAFFLKSADFGLALQFFSSSLSIAFGREIPI